jgi:hypothetical protein
MRQDETARKAAAEEAARAAAEAEHALRLEVQLAESASTTPVASRTPGAAPRTTSQTIGGFFSSGCASGFFRLGQGVCSPSWVNETE